MLKKLIITLSLTCLFTGVTYATPVNSSSNATFYFEDLNHTITPISNLDFTWDWTNSSSANNQSLMKTVDANILTISSTNTFSSNTSPYNLLKNYSFSGVTFLGEIDWMPNQLYWSIMGNLQFNDNNGYTLICNNIALAEGPYGPLFDLTDTWYLFSNIPNAGFSAQGHSEVPALPMWSYNTTIACHVSNDPADSINYNVKPYDGTTTKKFIIEETAG
jgi:hypothetical protein